MNSSETPEQSTLAKLERRLQQLNDRLQRYREWFVDQPSNHLAITMVIGVVLVSVFYVVLRLVIWLIAGLIDWLFLADTPPPPEPASPLEIAVDQLARHVGDIALRWSAQHPVGTDPALVLALWLIIGAGLLLFTRTLPGAVAMTGWTVATVWAVGSTTPGGNPVLAALLAGAIALAWCAWWLISAFISRLFR